jgi:hypothetical protein
VNDFGDEVPGSSLQEEEKKIEQRVKKSGSPFADQLMQR